MKQCLLSHQDVMPFQIIFLTDTNEAVDVVDHRQLTLRARVAAHL